MRPLRLCSDRVFCSFHRDGLTFPARKGAIVIILAESGNMACGGCFDPLLAIVDGKMACVSRDTRQSSSSRDAEREIAQGTNVRLQNALELLLRVSNSGQLCRAHHLAHTTR